jgi:hypothetical protein
MGLYDKYMTQFIKRIGKNGPNEVWGRGDMKSLQPYILGNPVKEAGMTVSIMWVTKDCDCGVTEGHTPHVHDMDEEFIFLSTDPDDPYHLGCDVEFWLGDGAKLEKLKFNTSCFVFVPKGLKHMPLFFKNVKRPSIRLMMGSDKKTTDWQALRG